MSQPQFGFRPCKRCRGASTVPVARRGKYLRRKAVEFLGWCANWPPIFGRLSRKKRVQAMYDAVAASIPPREAVCGRCGGKGRFPHVFSKGKWVLTEKWLTTLEGKEYAELVEKYGSLERSDAQVCELNARAVLAEAERDIVAAHEALHMPGTSHVLVPYLRKESG